MRFLRAGLAFALLMSPILFSGCRPGDATAVAQQGDSLDVVAVDVVKPESKTLERSTTQPATVHAWFEAQLHAQATGRLSNLKVDIGDSVAKDQPLVVIEVPDLEKQKLRQQSAVARLKADEDRARADVELAKAGVAAAEAERDAAAAQVAKATATLTAYQAEFKRVSDLVKDESVAGRLLDEAREHLQSAEAERTAVEAEIAAARAKVIVAQARQTAAEADVRVAEAATKEAESQLEEIDVLLSFATLTAPFDGVVTQRNVDPGDLVRSTQPGSSASSKPLLSVAQLDHVRVRTAVPENDAGWIAVGNEAAVVLRALPHRTFSGKVSRSTRRLDESTRTMMVEIDLPNPEGVILPGMYGEATVRKRNEQPSIVLPAGAVRYDAEGKSYVYALEADDRVKILDVATGLDDGSQIEITAGLSGDERIIGPSLDRYQDGQKVKVE